MNEKIIIDVRTREEYAKDHIKGAINIPLHDLESNHESLKNKKVYVYCNSGARAKKAKELLVNKQINAYILKGNWDKDYPREK